jgi:hypothetical protein
LDFAPLALAFYLVPGGGRRGGRMQPVLWLQSARDCRSGFDAVMRAHVGTTERLRYAAVVGRLPAGTLVWSAQDELMAASTDPSDTSALLLDRPIQARLAHARSRLASSQSRTAGIERRMDHIVSIQVAAALLGLKKGRYSLQTACCTAFVE